MSMVVKNNIAVQWALGQLNKNKSKLEKDLSKVSSGQKIVSAKDDASGYAISEKMREQVKSLAQDNQNVQNGSSMLKIAAGGVENIVDELRNLKELAINAANDSNSDKDRQIMYKEFTQKMATINDIATETNYNGKALIDGTYSNHQSSSKGNKIAVTQTVTETITKTVEEDPIEIINGDEVTQDGVYIIKKGFTGTITIGAENVKLKQEDPTTALENVLINYQSTSFNANLWIEDLNIKNTTNQSVINFKGTAWQPNNVLTVCGNNTLKIESDGTTQFTYATINVGNALTIVGKSGAKLTVSNLLSDDVDTYSSYYPSMGAAIGSNAYQNINSPISIGGGFNIKANADSGAAIGSGGLNGTIGEITIGSNVGNISAFSSYGVGMGGNGCPGIYVDSSSSFGTTASSSNPARTIGNYSVSADVTEPTLGTTTTTETITKTITTYVDAPNNQSAPMSFQFGAKANQSLGFFVEDMHTKSLGTKDLIDSTKSLGDEGYFINQEDEDRYYALSYDKDKQAAWLDTLTAAQNLTLDDISIITQKEANIAIRVLDGAIDYALYQATQIGSYLQKMEYTESNIVTMSENVQASESAIRDADMAKGMTEYTKANVLVQSARSMLAQANQNSSDVLSLLQ